MFEFWHPQQHLFEAGPHSCCSGGCSAGTKCSWKAQPESMCCCYCTFGNWIHCKAERLMEKDTCFHFCPPAPAAFGGRDIHLSWISCRRCTWKAADFPAYQLTNTGTGFRVTGSAWAGRSWCWLGTGEISTSAAVKAQELCFMLCGF